MLVPFETNLFQIADSVSVPFFYRFIGLVCFASLVAFGEFTFQKLVTNRLFGLEFCVEGQDTFNPHQDFEQVNFYKKSSLFFIDWTFRNWKIAPYLQLAKSWNISTKM